MVNDLADTLANKKQRVQEVERLVDLAKNSPLTDGGIRTSRLLSQALEKAPHHHEAQILLERVHQMFVPRWHFPMLADESRNKAYAQAIHAKVKPDDIVLDIGCGAGLTAMLAARAGAKHVYTCEQQPLIAQAAKKVIKENGLSDRITVIPKMSHDLIVGVDIPEPADVVISEIVDTMLLGEGALATLVDAMHRLAKPNARAIPERGTLKAQLVQSEELVNLWRPREAMGFKLDAFHRFANVAQITPNDLSACPLKPLGAAKDLFQFDFMRPHLMPAQTTEHLACTRSGTIHAVFVFFEMDLSPGIKVSNNLNSSGHWGRTAFLLNCPLPSEQCDFLPITGSHDTSQFSLITETAIKFTNDTELAPTWKKRTSKDLDTLREVDSFIPKPISA
jgi:precorrin-6B methylase 2